MREWVFFGGDREARPSAAASGTHADCSAFPRKAELPLAGTRPVRASLPKEKAKPTRMREWVSFGGDREARTLDLTDVNRAL